MAVVRVARVMVGIGPKLLKKIAGRIMTMERNGGFWLVFYCDELNVGKKSRAES